MTTTRRRATGAGSFGRLRFGVGAARADRAVIALGEDARLGRIDVAGDDQDRVLRRVEARVIGERVLAPESLDLVRPADDRRAVGMMGEQGRLHRLVELGAGIGVAMHAPLLQHHVALRRHHLVGQRQAGHAVGLELHQFGEVLLGDALEIGGVVVAGEGVLLAADLGDAPGELALRVGLGALEHQVFEEMGDARLALRVVGRAVAVPDHVGDHRRPAVGNDDDGQAVVEPEVDDAACGGARGRRLGDVETGLGGGKRHRDPGRQERRTAGGGPFSSGNRHIGCNLRRRQ